ncbi:YnhF family membrane protein [BEV proteobacterium]|nr:YnhF family membrane protein [Candidatus Symbiopectobacterium sp. Chty_BC]
MLQVLIYSIKLNIDLKMSLLTTVGALVMIMVFSFVAVLN